MRSRSFVLVLLTTFILASLAGRGVGEAKLTADANEDDAAALPVEVTSPATADIFATYQTTATIWSDADAPVLARVAGEVREILVEEGETVYQGQVLARLDGDRLRLQMRQAKANLEQIEKEYERFVRLHAKGLVSAAAYEELKYEMNALNAAYELKRLDYEYTNIRAPISGVVSAREIKAGQHVDVNDATFTITNTEKLVAYLRIPQTELNKFAVGHEATFRVDAMPEREFVATIARISPTIDMQNGTFRATGYFDNSAGLLAPGMFGRFDVAYEKHADALLIPTAALVREDGETVVYVVEDGAAVRRPITTGIENGDKIEVSSGLEPEDLIVVTGHDGLRDGSRVLARNTASPPVTG